MSKIFQVFGNYGISIDGKINMNNENHAKIRFEKENGVYKQEQWVVFEIKNEDICIEGQVNINTIDDDEPDFEWKQWDGTYECHLPGNHYNIGSDEDASFEILMKNMIEDTSMFHQCLWDFRNKINYTVERPRYTLRINPEEE